MNMLLNGSVFYFAKISKLASPLTTLPSCSAFCHLWLCTLSSDLWKQRLGLPPSADSTSCLGQERRSSKNIVALKDCGFRRAYKNPCIYLFWVSWQILMDHLPQPLWKQQTENSFFCISALSLLHFYLNKHRMGRSESFLIYLATCW